MKIVIAGGTGLVGKRLQQYFKQQNAELLILTTGVSREVDGVKYIQWMNGKIPEGLEGADAFINLAGVSLNDGRWTAKQKRMILESRLDTTNEIIRILKSLEKRPPVFINASAVGIYKPSETEIYTEQSETEVSDFLSDVVTKWENAVSQAHELGIRTCMMRFGVIIERDAGAFPLMLTPYKFYVGGTIGSGKQWVSWIHAEDVARAIAFAIEHEHLHGPINTVSPNPLRMKEVGKTISVVFNKPHYFPVPSPLLQIALGEKSILILEGQHVLPDKLTQTGFTFKYPTLKSALENLYN